MSSFNNVFCIVQNHCKSESVSGGESIRKIASEAGVSEERLHFYLGCLQEVGVIAYSQKEKKISLTDKGTKVHRIFPS